MSSLLILSLASSAAALSTLLRLGCDGGLDFGEKVLGGPLSARFNGFSKIVNFLDANLDESAKDATCGCPELSTDQLNMFFKTYSPKFLFNLVKGFEAQKIGPIANCGGLRSLDTNFIPKVDLPNSCTAERWNAGQGCQAAIKRKEGDLKIVLRMEKCAGREFPFFEVKCEGKDCDTVLTPCTADNECSDATNFSCLEFANTADQCAQETCNENSRKSLTSAAASKCIAGAYNPETLNGACSLGGAKFGPGFTYFYDSTDESRTKVPKSPTEIAACVSKTCGSGGQWSPPSPADKSQCFRALVVRKTATGAQCANAGEIVPNPHYPFTSQNTCNWDEIDDAKEYGLSQAVAPFGVGSTRYISNADDILGQFFGYDAVDFVKDPFGCRKSGDSVRTLVQLARKITDRHAGRSERTLSNGNIVGVCVPGQGYTLEAVPSNNGFTRYNVRGPMDDPTVVLEKNFGLKCNLSCVGASNAPAPGPAPATLFTSTGSPCTSQESADSADCSTSSCLRSSTSLSDFCTCYSSVLACYSAKSSSWCDSTLSLIRSFEDSRDTSCSSSSGSSGSSGLDGNCTASCGKDAFAYTGAAYGDAEKFDGASARKVRPVTAVTAGATVIAHFDCSASLAFLPNHPVLGIELSAGGALEFLSGFRNEHRAAYKCRATAHGGTELSNDQYDIRSFTLSNPLFFMTKPLSEKLTDIGVKFKDLRTRLLSTGAGRLAIPKSCSFDNWLEQGQCRLTFTGLGNAELFGEQTDLNAYLSVCPGSFLPEAYLECVGAGCKAFNGPISCAADSDCGIAGFRCNKFDDLFKGNSGSISGSANGASQFPQTVSTPVARYSASISKDSAKNGAFIFSSSIDVSGADLTIYMDFPKGVTDGNEVLIAKGPYTGKFATVRYFSFGGSEATCDTESIVGTISYKSDGIYASTTCTCLLSKKRGVSVPHDMELGTSIKNAFSKRQSIDVSEPQSSVSVGGTVANGIIGVFRTDKPECAEKYQTSLLPKFMALVSDSSYKPGNDGICFVDTQMRDAQGRLSAEVWANDQVQIDGSEITLRYLKSWKDGSFVQPIDDGKSLHDKFGKDAEWLEKSGRFCVSCPEGVNRDVGQTPGGSASTLAVAISTLLVAAMALFL